MTRGGGNRWDKVAPETSNQMAFNFNGSTNAIFKVTEILKQ